ncbi:MAG: hypothetical protein AAFN43_12470 [Pseudomonadota bacterium]
MGYEIFRINQVCDHIGSGGPSTSMTAIAFAAMVAASPANALSCSSEGFELSSTYNRLADEAGKTVFATGRFSGGPKRKGTLGGKPKTEIIQFTGNLIGKNGLIPWSGKISVKSTCVASWCGYLPKNGEQAPVSST